MQDDSLPKPPQIPPSLPLDEDPSDPKRFILQEVEEKANEISISVEEEFNIEKLQLVEAKNKKIRQEYERKEKQVEVQKKIEYSMQLNASRIKVLQAQDDVVNFMKEAASNELLNSLLKLKEPVVLLR